MSQPDRDPGRPVPRRLRRVGRRIRAPRRRRRRLRPGLARGAKLAPARFDRSAGRADRGRRDAEPASENHAGLDLPGRLEAYIRAPIYARVPGYLKSWKYDIGSKVKAGDVLAEIDTPDLDQQLMQARADLSVAAGQCQARADHRRALAVARRHRRGRQAGRRPAHLHLERQYRPGQGGAGERRPPGRRGGLQAPDRAIRRHRHRARNRHRRAHQCGGRRRRGAVRGLRNEEAARLCQRAAELCAERAAGHQGHDPRARTSRQDLQRNGRGFGPGRQSEHRHDADADHRRQQRG